MAVNLIDSTDIEITQTGDNIQLSTTVDMQTLESNVSTNTSNIANITGTILWTNPNPTNAFASQTITLSSDDYDVLEWYFLSDINVGGNLSTKNKKGKNAQLDTIFTFNSNVYISNRICTYNSDTSYTIGAAVGFNNGNISTQISTSQCIPLYIIGYKTGLFN